MVHNFKGITPKLVKSNFIAESAEIIGDVTAGENSSVWYNCTIRGDVAPIVIGEGSNIQDNTVIHGNGTTPAIIGNYVTVGHRVIIHACTIGDHCLIGMGAIVLDHAEIGSESIVGAGALVTKGKSFPPRSLILGSPAKAVRQLSDEEVESIKINVRSYIDLSREYGKKG